MAKRKPRLTPGKHKTRLKAEVRRLEKALKGPFLEAWYRGKMYTIPAQKALCTRRLNAALKSLKALGVDAYTTPEPTPQRDEETD